MTTESEELLANWRAVQGELYANRNPIAMVYDDTTLSLGIYFMRELALLRAELDILRKTRLIEPAFADGVEPKRSVRSRGHAEIEG